MSSLTAVDGMIRPRLSQPAPATHVLSNGRFHTLVTDAATGYSAWNGVALSRWAGDRVEDREGWFVWVRDLATGRAWRVGDPDASSATWTVRRTPGVLEFAAECDELHVRVEIAVAAQADLELRRVTIRNAGPGARRVDVTSVLQVVLAPAAADASHPAFSKLFVQTEWDEGAQAVLARRRPRGNDERHPWMGASAVGPGPFEFETDRARVEGRGAAYGQPAVLRSRKSLRGGTGNVLDPVLALRRTLDLAPGAEDSCTFLLAVGADRAATLQALAEARDANAVTVAFERARARAEARLAEAGTSEWDAERHERTAGSMLYGDPTLRASVAVLRGAGAADAVLGRLGVSSGARFALVLADEAEGARQLPDVLAAAAWWRVLGLTLPVIVMASDAARLRGLSPLPEGVWLCPLADCPPADRDALMAQASWVVGAGDEHAGARAALPRLAPVDELRPTRRRVRTRAARAVSAEALVADNGFGGFATDGREYVIRLPWSGRSGHRLPPLPWCNVIANESFGTIVSETGAGYTWSRNSREYRLTPWSNDTLGDPPGEAFYVRDDASGAFWSPLPGPAPQPADYEMRHGLGYSVCRHESEGLAQEVWIGVARREALKLVRVRVRNTGRQARRLSLFGYQRLVLGGMAEVSGRRVVTSHHASDAVLCACNPAAGDFAGPVAWASVIAPEGASVSATTDREAFLGRHGTPARPAAVATRAHLSPADAANTDPCFAMQVALSLAPGESTEVVFLLGEAADDGEAVTRAKALRHVGAAEQVLQESREFWSDLVSRVQVSTPSPELDLVLNGWLPYQTLSCRIWGRSAFYQSGGAFGFRDQLQDSMSLLALDPSLPRAQLLLNAAHQFVEGDVMHWWHPPRSRGLRTRFADDLLWLPHLAATYVNATGDWAVLDERARFVTAPLLEPGEDEVFLAPEDSGTEADLYEHCVRAIERSLGVGAHGLPLFGTGDWNDGMNRVGREGRGESVWMAFFLITILADFAPIAERRGDAERARRWLAHRDALREAVEREAWDGDWYRRGYYDNGVPLGSARNDECRIDALAQAWSVLSGAAPPERAKRAMESAEKYLISERDGLIRLLTPPFQDTAEDPGYIKGYVPGVRENGGQYTHAALWVVKAMVELGRRDRAAALLEMLSPVHHARTARDVARYQVEPYVIAADVYGARPHVGRGGWTWYTGSSGWMYRVAVENVLGVRLEQGDTLVIRPCVPDGWPQFRVSWQLPGGGRTRYEITVRNPAQCSEGVTEARVDGRPVAVEGGLLRVPVVRDGAVHAVEVTLGRVG